VNRKQWQRFADREKRIRELESELKYRNWKRKWGNRLSVLFLAISLVLMAIFALRVTPVQVDGGTSTDPTTVSFTESHVQWLDENYNESMENGFCLFGEIEGKEVKVQQVELIDNPLSQSRDGMSPTCLPQIYVRSGQLLLDGDYRFVGLIHTHSKYAALSDKDRTHFRVFDSVLSVYGVYNGERIAMYSDWNQSRPIHSVLRFS